MHKALALAALVVSSVGLAEGWAPRARAFEAKQAAERKRLGLDQEKARKSYPTPEVSFGAGGASWACPGETTTVLLEGRLAPGSLVGTSNPAVEIIKEEFTPKGWLGTLRVKPGTQGRVTLEVIAPVSGIRNTIELTLGCPREWVIDLKTGEKLVVKVIDGETHVFGEWFRGEKPLDKHPFSLGGDGKTFTLQQQSNAEDKERMRKAKEPLDNKEAQRRQQELAAKMQACASGSAAEMGACMQKHSAELQALMAQQQAAMSGLQEASGPKQGCVLLEGAIDGKKLKGNGSYCAKKDPSDKVPFTGVIR